MSISESFFQNLQDAVSDPARTERIFKLLAQPEVINDASLAGVLSYLHRDASCSEMIRHRFGKPWKIAELERLPVGSLGRTYAQHMIANNLEVKFFDDVPGDTDGAYLQMRTRETHDIWHAVTGFDTSLAGEAGLQAFLQAQVRGSRSAPTIMSLVLLHGVLFAPEILEAITSSIARGWMMGIASRALFGQKFEDFWERDLNAYRQELGLAMFFPSAARPGTMGGNC